jgi:hypothetical protein
LKEMIAVLQATLELKDEKISELESERKRLNLMNWHTTKQKLYVTNFRWNINTN